MFYLCHHGSVGRLKHTRKVDIDISNIENISKPLLADVRSRVAARNAISAELAEIQESSAKIRARFIVAEVDEQIAALVAVESEILRLWAEQGAQGNPKLLSAERTELARRRIEAIEHEEVATAARVQLENKYMETHAQFVRANSAVNSILPQVIEDLFGSAFDALVVSIEEQERAIEHAKGALSFIGNKVRELQQSDPDAAHALVRLNGDLTSRIIELGKRREPQGNPTPWAAAVDELIRGAK